jgi:hypothetical protein
MSEQPPLIPVILRRLTLGRAMLTDHRTGSPLGHFEHHLPTALRITCVIATVLADHTVRGG